MVTMRFIFFTGPLVGDARMTAANATSVVGRKGISITDWTKPFYESWLASQPFDLWHSMHRPNWILTSNNEDEFCTCIGIQPADKLPIIHNMMLFYVNQFLSSRKLVHTKYQWSSSWSADFRNINLGLIHALYYYRVP